MTALRFDTASLSYRGARANNEDACGYGDGCWVVADVGGHGGGEVAARLAVEALLGAWNPTAPLTTAAMTQGLAAAGWYPPPCPTPTDDFGPMAGSE